MTANDPIARRWYPLNACSCPQGSPWESEIIHDNNGTPRCPRCNVALGGDLYTAVEALGRFSDDPVHLNPETDQ